MDEKYRWNYDIKIVTKDGVIKYENEPLENIGKMALKHTPYDSLEATRHKPLIFSEVNEVHKEGKIFPFIRCLMLFSLVSAYCW